MHCASWTDLAGVETIRALPLGHPAKLPECALMRRQGSAMHPGLGGKQRGGTDAKRTTPRAHRIVLNLSRILCQSPSAATLPYGCAHAVAPEVINEPQESSSRCLRNGAVDCLWRRKPLVSKPSRNPSRPMALHPITSIVEPALVANIATLLVEHALVRLLVPTCRCACSCACLLVCRELVLIMLALCGGFRAPARPGPQLLPSAKQPQAWFVVCATCPPATPTRSGER